MEEISRRKIQFACELVDVAAAEQIFTKKARCIDSCIFYIGVCLCVDMLHRSHSTAVSNPLDSSYEILKRVVKSLELIYFLAKM